MQQNCEYKCKLCELKTFVYIHSYILLCICVPLMAHIMAETYSIAKINKT